MKTRSDAFQFEKELDWDKPAPGIRRQIMGKSRCLNKFIIESNFYSLIPPSEKD